MPLAEITAFLTSARAAYEIAKGINSTVNESERANKLSDLLARLLTVQEMALALQSEHQALILAKDELTKKLMQFEHWQETEREYELHEAAPQVFVYSLKPTEPPTKPTRWLCTRCWEDRIKSILQCVFNHEYNAKYKCPKCQNEIAWTKKNRPPLHVRGLNW